MGLQWLIRQMSYTQSAIDLGTPASLTTPSRATSSRTDMLQWYIGVALVAFVPRRLSILIQFRPNKHSTVLLGVRLVIRKALPIFSHMNH